MFRIATFCLSLLLLASCGGPDNPEWEAHEEMLEDLRIKGPDNQRERERNEIIDYAIANQLYVRMTDSGLFYQLNQGNGQAPSITDQVSVHYKGQLLDGTVFDSSYKRGEPTKFPLAGVIPGWQEALQMLKEGGSGKFIIPSRLGYGDRGSAGAIPPNSILMFDVELKEVIDGDAINQ